MPWYIVADFAPDDTSLRSHIILLIVLAKEAVLRVGEIWSPNDIVLNAIALVQIANSEPFDA